MEDLLTDFVAETRETLEAITGELVAWERDPSDRSRLDAIFRFVHTVKGSCGFLDLPRLERLSHAAEDALSQLRDGQRDPGRALVTAVLGIIDRIAELVEAIDAGQSLPDGDDRSLIAALSGEAQPADDCPPAETPGGPRAVSRSIRLPVELLDRLMAGVSDMVLARNDVARTLADADTDGPVDVAFERLSQCVGDMRDAITRTRMQRIETLFSALPRLARDVSVALGKVVALDIDGGDVELDREMIEMLRDPLTHIVRNAIDHGVEPPEARERAGKRPAATLQLSARQSGNQIVVEVADDGRGIDVDQLVARAVAAGVIGPANAAAMPLPRKLALIFEPGLSTADAVTSISGRGVGMDVVRANVERVGGTVEIDSTPGRGVRITLRVPLTLTIIPALTLASGTLEFALPRSAVEEIVRVGGEVRIERLGGAALLLLRGRRLPVVSLGALMRTGTSSLDAGQVLVIIKFAGRQLFALAVDAVLDHEELVVKPAAPAIAATGLYAGTALAQSGRPLLLLNASGLAKAGGVSAGARAAEGDATPEPAPPSAEWQALLFRDLDGARRAVRLSAVERIDRVAQENISVTGGMPRLVEADRLLPLLDCGAGRGASDLDMLRLTDGARQIGYLIAEVIDIVAVAGLPDRAAGSTRIGGVALIDGTPVEILEPFGLFAEAWGARSGASGPLCLLAADDHWTNEVLRPLIEAAGYRVTAPGRPDAGDADIVIANDGTSLPTGPGVPVVRLRDGGRGDAEVDGVYRYDRSALLAALATHDARRRN